MEKNNSKFLKEEDITKLLIKFSIPAIVGMLVNALYNIVDRIFVGKYVGNLGIGAIYVSSSVSLILMAFGMLVGIGGNSLSSIRLGQDRKEDSEKILGNAFTLLFFISLALTVIGFFVLEPLLKVFGATDKILPYAMDYTRIILLGAPLQAVGFGLNHFIRGEGNPQTAMKTMLIGAFINIVLDFVFIRYFNMGIKGAALATIIAQGVSAIWVSYYFIKGDSLLKLRWENLKVKWNIMMEIFSLGFAQFSMQLAASLVNLVFNNSLATYGGDIAVSSMGIIHGITMFTLMPIFGVNQGSQPIIGFNYGAEEYDRVIEALKKAIIAAVSIATLGWLMILLVPEKLFLLFLDKTDDIDAIMRVGVRGLRINLIFLPVIGAQIVSSNYFQATGAPKKAAILGLSRQVLFLIPAILIMPKFLGLDGVWAAGPASDIFAAIITGILLIKDLKKLERKKNI